MSFTQAKRQIRINTPLGADKLLLSSFYAKEELGRLSVYHAELLSEDASIALEDLLGQRVGIELDLANGSTRHFDAFVSRFTQVGESGHLARYHAVLHPWLWFLTRTSDCRIYQNLAVPAILKEVFDENGFSDYELRLSNSYRTREYSVQYRETDFNFVSRLMEEEGIYYFFSHEAGKHTLVLCDNYGSHTPLSEASELPYQPLTGSGNRRSKESITSWRLSKGVKSGRYTHTDYDFKKPRAALQANAPLARSHPHGEYEIFDYPGIYEKAEEGESYARYRIEELQAVHELLQGESDIRHISIGGLFTLCDHPREDQNREYLITETNFELNAGNYDSGSPGEAEEIYHCDFSCIVGKESFRSTRATPKPTVQGPQTAVVAGRSGEEIYTDEYGRVKVQFHWDRYGESNENSSCWVRVAQPWAGKNWGAISIPRIGQEVVVEFLEGDPDRPLITGSVYNADQMPPYGLPANMTQSGIKSRSTKGGSGENFNEIRFEDKKGSEQLFVHAEKNQDNVVKNDETTSIGNDRTENVTNDESITIGNDRTKSIGNNEKINVAVDRTEVVGGNETVSVGSNRSVNIGSNKSETIGVSKTETIGVAKALSIGGAYQVSVGAVMNETVGAAKAMQVANSLSEMIGNNRNVKVGKNQTTTIGDSDKLNVGKNLVIDAGDSVVIKTGKASITMKKDGTVTIQGKDITVKGSGVVNAKASKNVIIKGKKILQN